MPKSECIYYITFIEKQKRKLILIRIKNIKYVLRLINLYFNYKIFKKNITVNYDITNLCNLTCEHCYFYRNNSKDEMNKISDSEWEKIFIEQKQKGVFEVLLTGGEPLLRPKVIEAASNVFGNRHVSVVTNGTIPLPPDWQNWIYVSIDGSEETHDLIRGKGSFRKILKNIKNNKRVLITTTITKRNYNKILAFHQSIKDIGVRGLSFSFYTAKINDADKLEDFEIEEAIKQIKILKQNDPEFILISHKMLEVIRTKAHVKNCILKNGFVNSYSTSMELKSPCVFGEGVDCNNCGCNVPVAAHALKSFDIETIKIMHKIYTNS